MNKFILKYLVIFVTLISLMFFSLVSFDKYQSRKMMERGNPQMPHFEQQMPPPQPYSSQHMPQPPEQKGPPTSIPLLFITLISSIFTYIILRYIDKNFVDPLSNIEINTQKIKKGDLNVSFQEKSENNKVKETFIALNEMIENLKEKEKLQEEFIRNLVHDLRAPITAQERAMEILNEEMKDNELVQAMVENNDAYLKLINNIIDAFSQKEIKIDKIEFKLNKLVDNVISAIMPSIKEKNITIKKDIDKDFTIWSDYTSLHRIILNLVYNAVEHLENGKTVSIKAIRKDDFNVITVHDNGKGMNETQMKNIFTKHIVRANKENKLISGIGLSVVQDLVMKNDGEINVESVENSYTQFTVTLPAKPKNINQGI